jgi:hypothetical protein
VGAVNAAFRSGTDSCAFRATSRISRIGARFEPGFGHRAYLSVRLI